MTTLGSRVKTLHELANLLHTPNLSKSNIDAINHTMNYVLNSIHAPIVKSIEENG